MKENILELLNNVEKNKLTYKKLLKDEILFHEGDKCNNVGILISGELIISSYTFNGHEIVFNDIKENDIIEFTSDNLGVFYVKVKEVNCYDSLDELFILEGTRYVTLSINGPISHFFDGCTNLNNISGLTIRNVTAIDYILNNCLRISANLRSWDLSKCDEMSYALAGTQIGNNIDLSNLKLGSSSCRYNNLFGENLDNISINLSNSQVNVNAIETIIEGISNVSLNLTGVDLSKRTNFDGWFENCDLVEIILDNVTWSDKGIHFNRAFKNTRISKDFLLPITTTRAEECFSSIPTLTHIHSNWEQKYKDYVITNEWGEALSRETLIPTNCYAGNNAITHYDDIDIGVGEFIHGLDQIPIEWGGNGFTKGKAGIYVFTIPSDNYTINFGTIASRANFVTQQGIVSWGDGTPKQSYSDFDVNGSVTHTYAKAGRYVVKGHLHFSGNFNDNTKSCLTIVAAVPEGQPSNLGSTSFMVTSSFRYCKFQLMLLD